MRESFYIRATYNGDDNVQGYTYRGTYTLLVESTILFKVRVTRQYLGRKGHDIASRRTYLNLRDFLREWEIKGVEAPLYEKA